MATTESVAKGHSRDVFRCPECRGLLINFTCTTCELTYPAPDGIPNLLGSGPLAARYNEIGLYYDNLYATRTDVWREQGHSDEFTKYVVDLVEGCGPGRYLDVGCGEGFFLAQTKTMERFGIDLSKQALLRARARSQATVAVGAAERLPFPDRFFDVVTSVGAMEHFLEDRAALLEIRRVLQPQGRFIVPLLVEVTLSYRVATKVRGFLWPRPRPAALSRWLLRKVLEPAAKTTVADLPQQPVQNVYRPAQVRALFRRTGFHVSRVITKARCPDAPLPGHYMRIYCLERA